MRTRCAVLCVLVLLASSPGVPSLATAAAPPVAGGALAPATALLDQLAARPLESKIGDRLEAIVAAASASDELYVVVESSRALDLSRYSDFVHAFTWPAGEHVAVVKVSPSEVRKIATLPGVYAISPGDVDAMRDESVPVVPAEDADSLGTSGLGAWREQLRSAPPWSAPSAPGGVPSAIGAATGTDTVPNGWYDVWRGHAAREAWDLGYRGEGVRVGVIDWPVDFAHPDLHGTWAVLPEGSPYAGWPQVYDAFGVYTMVLDKDRTVDQRYARFAQGGRVEMYQSAPVTMRDFAGQQIASACFQALVPSGTNQLRRLAESCDFKVPSTSRSNQVRFGHHPDQFLVPLGAKPLLGTTGEYAGILLVDEAVAGVYDTLYIDLDNDRDFRDEKPITRADPLAWRDADGDGLADVSGGLVYWISDGDHPFPGSWTYGVEDDIPAQGTVIGVLYSVLNTDAGIGSHGTSCASNIAGQGVLPVPSGQRLVYRDLPGDGQPAYTNIGLAPGARVVSLPTPMIGPATAWRYAVFGEDLTSHDDDLQVVSNSYGYSTLDNDGWDANSRLLDYYVRTFQPQAAFLWATGNGGPGYGTITAAKPATGIAVGASTQYGAGVGDSITDTLQITYGDIVPFSDRGPTAIGRVGPHIAANGADGMGAHALNYGTGGANANEVWGGTSRSTPVAAGATALVVQAFKATNGRWPTWEETRAILMAGARYSGYDVFTAGAGVLDAGKAVRVAGGVDGVYATPSEWTAGGYHGTSYPAFASVIAPGEAATTTLTLHNPTAHDVSVSLSGQTMRRIGSYEDEITVDMSKEASYTRYPDYLVPIDRAQVPPATDLMVVRGRFPMDQFDHDHNMSVSDGQLNLMNFGVIQHTDINGDGKLWDDRDGNGVVDFQVVTEAAVNMAWDGGSVDVSAMPSQFTPPVPPTGVSGAMAWFGRACPGDAAAQPVTGKIALVERGVCPFVQKITAAQQAGAIAVVVFSDPRKLTIMGGTGTGFTIPGVLIPRSTGLDVRQTILGGKPVTATLRHRDVTLLGLGSSPAMPLEPASEIQPYEFMRMNIDYNVRNHWAIAVHHPLQRWADGLYTGIWHTQQVTLIPTATVSIRYDFYAYEPWDALRLPEAPVTVPATGTLAVSATLSLPADAPPGALQGAIFVDPARPIGTRILLPAVMKNAADLGRITPAHPRVGGYTPPTPRFIIPVSANVTPRYDWQGAITLGGAAGRDEDMPYDNGAMWGGFNWMWREESGDWRFFFVDADEPPANTRWLFRTTWDDPQAGMADIDTRVYGPVSDAFSDPDNSANREEDRSDVLWYGPHTLDLIARSAYRVQSNGSGNSIWPFATSSGAFEDWVSAPAARGLHEVMLDNVLFSGNQFAMPFRTDVSAVQVAGATLVGETCGEATVTPQIDLTGIVATGYGLSPAQQFTGVTIKQEVRDDPSSAAFKRDINLAAQSGRFAVTLDGEDDDDLDVYVLYDINRDLALTFPEDVVGVGGSTTADEHVEIQGPLPTGRFQVWVHGYAVRGALSMFNLTVETATGNDVTVQDLPATMPAGQATSVRVCVAPAAVEGKDGPLSGTVLLGPAAAPGLFGVPVRWVKGQ